MEKRNLVIIGGVTAAVILAAGVVVAVLTRRAALPESGVPSLAPAGAEPAGRQPPENVNAAPATVAVPNVGDLDYDGLGDAEEAALGTDPRDADTDKDGVLDGDEVRQYKTDPKNPDTDGDGISDGDEIRRRPR